ncbi:MAG: hypothetical protein IT229_03640 [Flavobacteriales bacterium]|nr:hypothetical protein [Flavobacteriales bacterium]
MKRPIRIVLLVLPLLVALSGCYKDETDVAAWTNNPFDRDYTGPSVFSVDTTYIEVLNAPPTVITRQVVQFQVNSSLFLASAPYQVRVKDLDNGQTTLLSQYTPGTDTWRFTKLDFTIGQELCLEVRLSNDLSDGRPDTICATLQ